MMQFYDARLTGVAIGHPVSALDGSQGLLASVGAEGDVASGSSLSVGGERT